MKKIMMGVVALGLMVGASNAVMAQAGAKVNDKGISLPEVPKFADADANKGVAEFNSLVKEYGPALKAQDAAKSQEFGTKVNAWQQNAVNWASKLSADDQAKLQQYMQGVGAALQPQEAAAPAASPAAVDPSGAAAAPKAATPVK